MHLQAEAGVDDAELQDEEIANTEGETPEEEQKESESGEEETVITLGEESPTPQEDEFSGPAPAWVKELRESNRAAKKALREREEEIARLKGQQASPQTQPVGTKPTLDSCGFDEDKFETELTAWYERKRNAEEEVRKKEEAKSNAEKAWKTKQDAVSKAGAALKVRDYEGAVEALTGVLSEMQQALIVDGFAPERAAKLAYVLGKNPKRAKELAAIENPVQFAVAVADLSRELKETTMRKAPEPEKTIRSGSAAVVLGSDDKRLKQLEAEAERTGDRSKVIAYKAELRQKSK
jgi:hypothetical protein